MSKESYSAAALILGTAAFDIEDFHTRSDWRRICRECEFTTRGLRRSKALILTWNSRPLGPMLVRELLNN